MKYLAYDENNFDDNHEELGYIYLIWYGTG